MKAITLKYFFILVFLFSSFISSAYNVGDFGSYSSLGPSAVTWNAGNCWATWNGASWVATLAFPTSANNVYILSGYTMTLDNQGYSGNLTVEATATLYVNGATNNYVDVYGSALTCNGTIGNGATYDGISFDFEGSSCTISGAGAFSGSHFRKATNTNYTSNLTVSMNVTLCFGPTSGTLTKNTSIYNHTASSTFNITFSAGYTTDLIPYTGAGACNTNLSIAGSDGTQTVRSGTYTINGTVIVSGYTIFATAGGAGYPAAWIINNGGVLETDTVVTSVAGGNGLGGSTLTINSGGKLLITGPSSSSSFSLVDNTYILNPGDTVEYGAAGVQFIDTVLTYSNLTLSSSGNKTAAGTLTINQDLNVRGSAILIPSATTPVVNIGGNWTDWGSAGFTATGSSVTFNGSGNQTIHSSNGQNFGNVIINKSAGYIILDSASKSKMSILSPDSLKFISGIIIADTSNSGNNVVFINNGAGISSPGANDNSFVYGRVERSGNTGFTFPVGKGSEYRPITISSQSGIFVMYAQYFRQNPGLAYIPTDFPTNQVNAPIDSVSRCEYWTLETTSNARAAVTLSWDTYSCGISDPTTLFVAVDSVSTGNWNSLGNGGITGTVTQGTVISSSTIQFVSTHTYAYTLSTSASFSVNPLPISLLSFTAKAEQEDVLLFWTTASEINNDYFTIEKTNNGIDFESVGEVKGAGTSTREINYTFIDPAPYQGVSYYRLKQTDYNGHYSYSQLSAINFTTQQTSMITLFPNPTPDHAFINISWETMPKTNIKEKTYTLHVFDISGREAMQPQVINFSYGMLQMLDVSALPKGIYELQLNSPADIQRTSLVKE